MDKLKLAHEYALEMAKQGIPLRSCLGLGWKYADAMQAEADKRVNKERPKVLFEPKCEVDWRVAPREYHVTGWYNFKGVAHWIADEFPCGPAPSFGFTGSHVVERPNGL